MDKVIGCGIWIVSIAQQDRHCLVLKVGLGDVGANVSLEIPTKQATLDKFDHLQKIQTYLEELQHPSGLSQSHLARFLQQASRYFVISGKLCRKEGSGRHQLVATLED